MGLSENEHPRALSHSCTYHFLFQFQTGLSRCFENNTVSHPASPSPNISKNSATNPWIAWCKSLGSSIPVLGKLGISWHFIWILQETAAVFTDRRKHDWCGFANEIPKNYLLQHLEATCCSNDGSRKRTFRHMFARAFRSLVTKLTGPLHFSPVGCPVPRTMLVFQQNVSHFKKVSKDLRRRFPAPLHPGPHSHPHQMAIHQAHPLPPPK